MGADHRPSRSRRAPRASGAQVARPALGRLFGGLQRDELIRGLGIGDQTVREREGVEQVIRAARDDMLGGASGGADEQLVKVRTTAAALQQQGRERFQEVKRSIDHQISEYRPEFSTSVELSSAGEERAQWYRAPVLRIAKRHHYFANPRAYQAWLRLRIADRDASTWDDLVISFHAIGREFRGLVAVTAFYEQHQIDVDGVRGERRLTESEDVTDELFQINYLEPLEQAAERFGYWLEGVVTIGLDRWRAGLSTSAG